MAPAVASRLLAAAVAAAALAAVPVPVSSVLFPEEYVNTLGGTDSRYDFSRGNLLPLVGQPWGFNTWAPQTDNDPSYASWWFHPTDRRFFGIRCTHQPSPWISDYGNFRIQATVTDPAHTDPWQFSGYNPDTSVFKPYYFRTQLLAYGTLAGGLTTVELTATGHAAVIRVTYPPYVAGPTSSGYNQTRRILLTLASPFTDQIAVSTAAGVGVISGYTTVNSGGVPPNFAHYFSMTVNSGSNGTGSLPTVVGAATVNDGTNLYAYIDLDPTDAASDVLTLRVATSLISPAQANVALALEVNGRGFDDVMAEAKAQWGALLSTVNVTSVGEAWSGAEADALLTTFYSSLYRASQFPRQLTEVSANLTQLHYSPYDPAGGVWPGPLSTDQGFWDSYRTVGPLDALVYPTTAGTLVQGWVNAYKEGGWLPKWASPGYRGAMVGSLGDVSLADAIVKNLTGFDVAAAYAAIRQDAFVVPPPTGVGRLCLAAYLANGYIPEGAASTQGACAEVVACTQNYWQADFATAQAAAALGYHDDAAILLARSLNYSTLFEPGTAFFRSRAPGGGAFTEPFDEFAWGGDYTEASAWQYRAYIPHDVAGLAALYAGAGRDLCDVLDATQTTAGVFHVGAYGTEIHEMTEMALLCFGQGEHDNQPAHHAIPMMVAVDATVTGSCAARGQYWSRRVLQELYGPGADMFCGDEDNGEMAAWYVLNALGLYALSPGTTAYILTSPLFANVTVNLPFGAPLRIASLNNNATNYYVAGVTWNGVPVPGVSVDYFDLIAGGDLVFTMSPSPVNTTARTGGGGGTGTGSGGMRDDATTARGAAPGARRRGLRSAGTQRP